MAEKKKPAYLTIPLPPVRYVPPILEHQAQMPVFEDKQVFHAVLGALRSYPSPQTFFALSTRDVVRYINSYIAKRKGRTRMDYRLSQSTLSQLLALFNEHGLEHEYFQKYRNAAQIIELIDAMRLYNKIEVVDNLYNARTHVDAEKFKFMLERRFKDEWGQQETVNEVNITGIQLIYNKTEIPVEIISSETDMEQHMTKYYGHATTNGHSNGIPKESGA